MTNDSDIKMFCEVQIADLSKVIDISKIQDDCYVKESGLKVNTKGKYNLVKYEKNSLLQSNYSTIGLLRSVVFKNDKLVSFSPPKSIPLYEVLFKQQGFDSNAVVLEEYVDGTMINVFFDEDNWHISTRSVLGAETTFYSDSKTTYLDMFRDCVAKSKMRLDLLDPKYCYSFVIKHPDNRIVEKIVEPCIYLCGVYRIQDSTVFELPLSKLVSEEMKINPEIEIMFRGTCVRIPRLEVFTSLEEVEHKYGSIHTQYQFKGIIIRVENSRVRTKIVNPNYSYVRKLRGNQSKLQFKYYDLRKKSLITEYLKYFPEHSVLFQVFEEEIKYFEDILFLLYREVFMLKRLTMDLVPYEYKNHLRNIHDYYIFNLSNGNRQSIRKDNVKHYSFQLQPAMLMFSINYSKHNISKALCTVK